MLDYPRRGALNPETSVLIRERQGDTKTEKAIWTEAEIE